MADLVNEKEVVIEGANGTQKTFYISTIPYLSGGRDFCLNFLPSLAPKVGDYLTNERLARVMYKHIDVVDQNGNRIRLSTDALVNNHIDSFLMGARLEEAMLEHNMGFSVAGKISGFLQMFKSTIEQYLSKILTASAQQSSTPAPQPTENSNTN